MRHFHVGLVFGLVLLAVSARAQDPPPLAAALGIGSRVRLQSSSVQAPLKGTVVGFDDKSLTLAQEVGPPLTIPLPAVTKMEVGRGYKRNVWKGLAIGALSGALLGLTFPVEPADCGPESSSFCSRGEAVGGGALTFGLMGLLVGSLAKTEQWAPVTLETRPRLSTTGRPGGFQMAVRLRF